MLQNSILNLSTENLTDLIGNLFDVKINELKKELITQSTQPEPEDLMTRDVLKSISLLISVTISVRS
jgi:hypothetical protein